MHKLTQLTSRGATRVVHPQLSQRWGGYVAVVDADYTLLDPFIFLVHHVHSFSAGEVTGFPPHPHRGFETVTYAIEGGFDHGDSRGNKGRYGSGDVQWLTTGKGVLHSEMFVTDKTKPSTFNGFQLWLNLHANKKMGEPGYQMMWNKDIPVVTLTPSEKDAPLDEVNSQAQNGGVWLKIITGTVNGVVNSANRNTIVSFLHVKIDPRATWIQHAPREHNSFAYVMNGEGEFSGDRKKLAKNDYVIFNNEGDRVDITNTHTSNALEFVYLEGKPIKEPMAHQGPVVMNTQQELKEAFADIRAGKFGYMSEDDY